ncbi:bifunctional UDP-N-acetylglucosamine diphosphorylase/glucosamine-1-phosphate N-acetyltransferase GlmU [Candidatus Pandoraea novymonadis]|nr:bifunctional UDP-N-acetylglucosamine diphosphorylase/glucosamine-1-phosphate N-acetyltransferase GlmU [Candidatus Pandoraea novymonadis]
MNIVILAAGMGKRMRSSLPKVLHLLAGRSLLSHVITTARELIPNQLIVVVGCGATRVRETIVGDDIQFVDQFEQLGTGHAVKQSIALLHEDVSTLVLYGDVPLTRVETLRALLCKAGQDKLGLLTVEMTDPTGYGRIERDTGGNIMRILEQKDADEAQREIREVNTGIIVVPTLFLKGWLSGLQNKNAQGEYYLTDVVECAVANGIPVVTEQPAHEWESLGINSKAQLTALERIYQRNLAETLLDTGVMLADANRFDVRGELVCGTDVSIDINCVFEGQVILGDDVSIGPNCVIRNATIATGTRIEAFSHLDGAKIGVQAHIGPYARLRPGADLADEVHIGNFVEVKNTTLAKGVKANHLSYLGDATVGTRANIGAGVVTCNYDGAKKHRTMIEDDVFVGSSTQLVAPVRLRRGTTVAAGTTIWKDTSENSLVMNEKIQTTKNNYIRPRKGK